MKSFWLLATLQGLVLIMLGCFLLVNPETTLVSLVEILGFYWLIGGVIELVLAIFGKVAASTNTKKKRSLELAAGIVGVAAGLVVLNNPATIATLTGGLLVYLIAFAFLFSGAIKLLHSHKNWSTAGLGLLYLVIGMLLLLGPLVAEITAVVMIVGAMAAVGGMLTVALSVVFREV